MYINQGYLGGPAPKKWAGRGFRAGYPPRIWAGRGFREGGILGGNPPFTAGIRERVWRVSTKNVKFIDVEKFIKIRF